MWWQILVAGIVYIIFREQINKKIKEIKKWLKLNKDTLDKWKNNQQIMSAYNDLKDAFEQANLDRKWTGTEILFVLSLAIRLFKLIKEAEEK